MKVIAIHFILVWYRPELSWDNLHVTSYTNVNCPNLLYIVNNEWKGLWIHSLIHGSLRLVIYNYPRKLFLTCFQSWWDSQRYIIVSQMKTMLYKSLYTPLNKLSLPDTNVKLARHVYYVYACFPVHSILVILCDIDSPSVSPYVQCGDSEI